MPIDKLKLKEVSKIYPLKVEPYEQYMDVPENEGVIEKINTIVQSLHQIGRLNNDVVRQWNAVMAWIVGDGLRTYTLNFTNEKIDEVLLSGEFEDLLKESILRLNVEITETLMAHSETLKDTAKRTEVRLKSVGININDFDEATRQAILLASGINVNYILGYRNVAPDNTTFFVQGKNLFNKATATLESRVDAANGNIIKDVQYAVSDFIRVFPNRKYNRTNASFMAFYDINKKFVKGTANDQATVQFTAPENAHFIRVSLPMTRLNVLQVEEGEIPTSFEEYSMLIGKEYLPNPLDDYMANENESWGVL